MQKNKPKLRFPEFTDAWEQQLLKNIANKVTEKNKNELYQETFTNSAEFGIISQRDFFDKDISNAINTKNYFIISPNDFVYNPRISNLAPVGPIKRNKLKRKGIMSPLYFIFRFSIDINYYFLDAYFETTNWHLYIKSNGDNGVRADRIAIKDSLLIQMPIPLPTLPEQQKIGQFFSRLDSLITLHQRKLENAKKLKKSLLQKMFPKNGKDFPEIRFPEFTDAWEQRRLGDVLTISSQRNKSMNFSIQDVLSVSREVGTVNQIQYHGRSFAGKDISNYKVVTIGQMVYTKSPLKGAPYGIFQQVTLEGIVSPLYAVYNSTKKAKASFVYLMLCNDNIATHYLSPLISKGAKNTILVDDKTVLSGSLSLPTLPEQQKIGQFFSRLDSLITLHQRKLDNMRQLKKSLLQQMFV